MSRAVITTRLLVISFFLLADLSYALAHAEQLKVRAVKDGDTFYTDEEASREVRLPGIDAPELSQPYGAQARDALIRLVEGKTVEVEWTGECTYGRFVGKVTIPADEPGSSVDVQRELVRTGNAFDSEILSWALSSG